MEFITEAHGRYEIKSGPLAGAWAANAFLHKKVVAKASGSTREEAIAHLKGELDRMEQFALSDCDTEGAPDASVYERAFRHLLPDMPKSYIAMLRAHLAAPDHLISATKLAAGITVTLYLTPKLQPSFKTGTRKCMSPEVLYPSVVSTPSAPSA
jgi:hypothetical protein